jgi:hypothetical protein
MILKYLIIRPPKDFSGGRMPIMKSISEGKSENNSRIGMRAFVKAGKAGKKTLDKWASRYIKSKDRLLLTAAAKSIRLKGGYRLATAGSLDYETNRQRRELLSQCQKIGLSPNEGIVILDRYMQPIGAWEFTRDGERDIRLVRIGTDSAKLLDFKYHNNMNVSTAMFQCISRFCKLAGINRVRYGRSNDSFEKMVGRFVRQNLIGNRLEHGMPDGKRIYYDIL